MGGDRDRIRGQRSPGSNITRLLLLQASTKGNTYQLESFIPNGIKKAVDDQSGHHQSILSSYKTTVFLPGEYWVLVGSLDPWERLHDAGSVLRAKVVQENAV